MSTPREPESVRVERLRDAQAKAAALFGEIERRGMVRPGVGERQLSDEIRDLAADMFGVTRHWHRRVVRAGENTLLPFHADPPDRVLADDDIAYLDLGPIFEEWEADFGRTFVLGEDPDKLALRDALPRVWQAGRTFFEAHADITGAQLYEHVVGLAQAEGFEFGAPIAGHLLGEFPHKKISGDEARFYVAPGSDEPMRRTDPTGRVCHWILEVHLANRARGFGGFYEQLLDVV
ncbi:M24 family metallopeptidase [Mycolicibacter arupensis]|uniref:Aminopeptidase n=1 Tax=Mycolicibacter arupensis TaxID=342002 RepID=A0A0F5MWC0_9MYCO|nr:M24 family metallopeptidase [Mycolicibacter arupensis]KKB99113.1 aminopeptidase [Mycolicibacter arupensis]MCV7276539.1 aminopeptidase P family protein [Mycolicibacter arupensis]OQZ97145.1 aminopeptidase [Mycolicibacter arupensis]TXI56827.1 MAG: aminopeptidase P family protein [Mycolicibacter arupensis]